MPIHLSIPIKVATQDEFHAVDRVMMGHAIAAHNEFGRLLDEELYKAEVAERCRNSGMTVTREVLIRVTHGVFSKDYFIDLLLDGSTIVEGKCSQAITPAHRGQSLNYLLLAGTHHGSLVNFRPHKLKREFVSTRLTHELRQSFSIRHHQWPQEAALQRLSDIAVAFCGDVGLGLDLALYRQALATLLGGISAEIRAVPVLRSDRVIHEHLMHLVSEDVALAVTAVSAVQETRRHLERLLSHTRLRAIAWINLPLGELRFELINRQKH